MLPLVSANAGFTNQVAKTSPPLAPERLTFRNLGLTADQEKLAAARARLQAEGISAWARLHGFRAKSVHDVLSGTRPCIRGKSHEIAVALGLKDAPTT